MAMLVERTYEGVRDVEPGRAWSRTIATGDRYHFTPGNIASLVGEHLIPCSANNHLRSTMITT